MSDTSIAEYVGLNDKTVARYRAELETTSELPKLTKRTGKDGKVYDTTNIGTARVTPDDPVVYVLSLNLHRRHLNESQRAMVAVEVRECYAELAKGRQREHGGTAPGKGKHSATIDAQCSAPRKSSQRGRASDEAGAALNVSGMSVDRARVVIDKGDPELVKAVDCVHVLPRLIAKLTRAWATWG